MSKLTEEYHDMLIAFEVDFHIITPLSFVARVIPQ